MFFLFCFFFKQKTAYEMRISDWSSDVCSSDLSEAEKQAFPVLCRGAAMRFLMTRCYDWLNTPADAMVNRKDPLAFRRRLDFYIQSGEGLIGRSEEHTSELQSLMRISYAVFCLKKKKTHQQKNKNIKDYN